MIRMGEIIYNRDTKDIQFKGSITSFVFYEQLFNALREHYRENGLIKIPTFSFVYVDFFDPLVVPNLVGIGVILSKAHEKEKVPLNFARISSTKFLDDAWFFDNVGKEKFYNEQYATIENDRPIEKYITQKIGLSIFDFDERNLGFYNNLTVQKHNNPEHKVRMYPNDSLAYYLRYIEPETTQDDLDSIRTDKSNVLKPQIEKHFFNILKRIGNKEQVNTILKILTELVCNSVLYSDSLSAVMLHSRDQKTKISVSDFGVGFEYSFDLKKKKFGYTYNIINKFSAEDQIKYKNYLFIFEALHYSKIKSDYRENLFTLLKNIVMSRHGIMRIHYVDTQVIFTSDRCKNCNKRLNPPDCVSCLLEYKSEDKIVSPIRFDCGKLNGVHIEVEFNF